MGPLPLSTVYASPNYRLQAILWNNLEETAESVDHPWVVAGDLNDIASVDDSRTFAPDTSSSQRRKFAEHINKWKLVDLGSTGPKFTWSNGRQGLANMEKRLARALCNEKWRSLFPEGMVQNLPRTYSDHSPCIVHALGKSHFNNTISPFSFWGCLDPGSLLREWC